MTPHDADLPDTEPTPAAALPADATPTEGAAEAPRRKRAPRKKPTVEAVVLLPVAGEAELVTAAAPLIAHDATAPDAAAPAPLRVSQSGDPAVGNVGAPTHPAPTAGSDPSADGVMNSAGDAPADGADGAAGPAEAGDAGPRRSRNRRRGRRKGERTEGADGATDMAVDGEGSEAAPDVAEPELPRLPPADVGEVFAEVLSGAFDTEPAVAEAPAAMPPKRVLAADPDAPKLHKVLAQAGVGSRRDLEQMILDGRVTVNDQPAHIGQRISFGDRIAVGGKPVRVRIAPPPPRVLAYHKPAGEVVTHDDPQQRPTVFRRLPRLQQGKWQSVGRLDINTEGLLLFTNSGELANQLMHPRFGVEREYAVRSLGVLDAEAKARLLEGVEIDGQRAAFKSLVDGGGEGVNHWYRVVITEGRNREVRRLFEAVGHAVSRLIRIRYGSVVLPRGLKRGVWTDLDDGDVRLLRQMAGGGQRIERDGPGAGAGPAPVGGSDARPARGRRGGRGGRDGPSDRPPRNEQDARPPRPPREPRPPRPPRMDAGEGGEHIGPIPNPLQQTFDKRAIQQARAQHREPSEDGPIPNPLQQTYDKRALQRDRAPSREISEDGPIPNPLQQTYDKRFTQKPSGFGPGGSRAGGGGGGGGRGGSRAAGGGGGRAGRPGDGSQQPDPMKTSVGYIGGDAFLRKGAGKGGGRGGRGGGQGGGGQGGQGGPGRGRGGRNR